jgi:hypothetical protein
MEADKLQILILSINAIVSITWRTRKTTKTREKMRFSTNLNSQEALKILKIRRIIRETRHQKNRPSLTEACKFKHLHPLKLL